MIKSDSTLGLTSRHSHPHSSPQCPTPLWQSSKHLWVKEKQFNTTVMGKEIFKQNNGCIKTSEKWGQVYQERSQTSAGNLFPLLQSIPTLDTKAEVRRSKLNVMKRDNYPIDSWTHRQPGCKELGQYVWDSGICKTRMLDDESIDAGHQKGSNLWMQVNLPFIFSCRGFLEMLKLIF